MCNALEMRNLPEKRLGFDSNYIVEQDDMETDQFFSPGMGQRLRRFRLKAMLTLAETAGRIGCTLQGACGTPPGFRSIMTSLVRLTVGGR
jgi:hypothetical protein